ncbi:MAG: tetratricopeptide repeat protein [Reyranella sp.]|nr:tetratricopeptide repeat protein [Reyranella sp.]MDP3160283.1 tetratricopeptide repeat protein [Reyranella sp.]
MPHRLAPAFAVGALLLAVHASPPASAQGYTQFNRWCYGEATPARTIQGCDAVIRWARETPRDTGTAFYNRGLALAATGQLDRAIQDYGQAIRLKPDLADAYNNRGIAWRLKGDDARALEDFDQALRLKSDDVDALYNRGLALMGLGQYDKAIAGFDAALRLKPDDVDAVAARGMAWLRKGDSGRALQDFDQVLGVRPGNVIALYGRGIARRRTGNHKGGDADIAAAKALQPDIADEFARMGLSAS